MVAKATQENKGYVPLQKEKRHTDNNLEHWDMDIKKEGEEIREKFRNVTLEKN